MGSFSISSNMIETLSANSGFEFVISTRQGGVSPGNFRSLNLGLNTSDNPEYINENRLKFLSSVLKDNRQLVYAKQVHGSHIVSAENVNLTTEADGFFTQSKRFALSVTIADCHPVLLAHKESGFFALLHMGWRGSVAGILNNALNMFLEKNIQAKDLIFIIGPGIGFDFFEVGPEVKRHFRQKFWSGLANEKGFLDLGASIIDDFLSAGGLHSSVSDSRECTYANTSKFFSYRRDGQQSGRMMALAWRKN